MISVQKKTMDDAIRVTRKFWNTGDIDYLGTRLKLVQELSKQALGNESYWSEIAGLIDSVIKLPVQTKNAEADNELVYSVFELIGITTEAA